MMDKLIEMDKNLRIGLLLTAFFLSFIIFFATSSGWFVLLGFVFIGILIVSNIKYDKKYRENIESSLEETLNQYGFVSDVSYLSDDYISGIAINESTQKLALLKRNARNQPFVFKTFDFNEVLESEIIEDGASITKTSRGSQIGGAIVGGALAGGVGAVIGGLSAKQTSNERVYRVTLNIVVNDLLNPIYEINFLNVTNPLDKNSELVRGMYSDINKWHKMISVILKRNQLNS
ncbi:hypothetical protein [Heyndrickxia shackletonii]|uniref:hypothetical protein n=1 Tax=Heyndrickxia shackletonii TaxID=157838 RepID=UPI0006EC1A7E|nr:hypothetical protein [Heyndrickxia shackletonii]NEZ02212.1 DUF92 domain-containing protein [Heyndrickxia shackletonii]